jgi:hypothetical protein
METYGIDAIPFQHPKMDEWRNSRFQGITYHMPNTNVVITGGVDDVWVDPSGQLMIVDYKATSKEDEVDLDADWQIGYKRQMEVYQWLLRQNGYKVSNTGYFVYCNGQTDRKAFDGKLEFDITLIPYEGNDSWVEKTIIKAHSCLNSGTIPEASPECDYCNYIRTINSK